MVLSPLTDPPSPERAAFLAGLRALGYIEGKSIIIEYRSAKWNPELFDDLAEDLVRLNVDVIVTTGGRDAAAAAKKATTTIPIVMAAGDPVGAGLAASLARPGGNVTGLSILAPELGESDCSFLRKPFRASAVWLCSGVPVPPTPERSSGRPRRRRHAPWVSPCAPSSFEAETIWLRR